MDSNFNFGGNKTSEAPSSLAAEAWAKPARTESSSETGTGHLRDLFKDRSNQTPFKTEGPKPSENKQESKTESLPQFSWSIPAFPAKPEAKPAQAPETKPAQTKTENSKTDDKLPPLRIGTGNDERPPRRNERTDENKPLRAGLSHRYNDF